MKSLFLFLLVWLGVTALQANVRMCALFGDHMVLQQEAKVPVWGWAAIGEKVTVKLGDQTAEATTGSDGKWRVDFKPMTANSTPQTLTVTGTNTLTFNDVLIGEVWVASGQSNMEVPINWMADAAQVTAQATDTQLRTFYVEHGPFQATSLTPRDDISGHWVISDAGATNGFSAVAYFFGRELRAKLKRPVGIIGSYVGGTPASAWISLSGLEKAPAFQTYVDGYYAAKAAGEHYPADLHNAQRAIDQWCDQYQAAIATALTNWKAGMVEANAGNNPQPAIPQVDQPPNRPSLPPNPAGSRYTPCVLFNALITPLIPYAMKGVIWYQGEDNAVALEHAHEYATLFPRLITDWREKWGQGEFPFLYVQLASFSRDDIGGAGGINWAIGRESQSKALALPKTGMVTAVDIGGGTDVHPRDKLDVGLRLALQARHIAYGEELVYTGPTFEKMTAEGATIRVTFKDTGTGLIIGKAPWVSPGIEPTPDTSLVGFTIAGADKKFVVADAKIDGKSVVLSSAQVTAPVAARYCWANLTQANLYNKEGLPAFPFRTDTWDDVASPANPPVMH